jgi:hypothetical protein
MVIVMASGVYQFPASNLQRQGPHQLPLRHGIWVPGDEAVPQAAGEAVLPLRQAPEAERTEASSIAWPAP